jgi:hypothetical protein
MDGEMKRCPNCKQKTLMFIKDSHVEMWVKYYHCLSCRHSFRKWLFFYRDIGREAVR